MREIGSQTQINGPNKIHIHIYHNQQAAQKLEITTEQGCTLLSFPSADIRSAHSLVYSNALSALSTCETYARYLESQSNSHSSRFRTFIAFV